VAGATSARESARGVVFDDANRNGVRDAREQGIRDIRVSNGREIVLSDRKGRYEIPAPEHGAIFVIQPPEWIAPLDEYGRPRFFYMHKPEGSPELDFMGSSPTGPLPASVDFPLHRVKAAREFSALFFGDTQPDDQRDIDFLAHDVVEELIGREAAFGVVLGDVLNDDLALFGSLCATLAALDVPMYYLPGNHDQNYDSPGDRFATETFEAKVGPRYFSFEQGSVHFIVLDNVHWRGKVSDPERWSGGNYVAGLDERQRAWLARDLELTPGEMLVVPMMHIPFNHPWIEEEKQALFRLLESRRHCFSMAAHAHYMEHDFVGMTAGG